MEPKRNSNLPVTEAQAPGAPSQEASGAPRVPALGLAKAQEHQIVGFSLGAPFEFVELRVRLVEVYGLGLADLNKTRLLPSPLSRVRQKLVSETLVAFHPRKRWSCGNFTTSKMIAKPSCAGGRSPSTGSARTGCELQPFQGAWSVGGGEKSPFKYCTLVIRRLLLRCLILCT